jgi:hypothetical protein
VSCDLLQAPRQEVSARRRKLDWILREDSSSTLRDSNSIREQTSTDNSASVDETIEESSFLLMVVQPMVVRLNLRNWPETNHFEVRIKRR